MNWKINNIHLSGVSPVFKSYIFSSRVHIISWQIYKNLGNLEEGGKALRTMTRDKHVTKIASSRKVITNKLIFPNFKKQGANGYDCLSQPTNTAR